MASPTADSKDARMVAQTARSLVDMTALEMAARKAGKTVAMSAATMDVLQAGARADAKAV